MKKSIRHRLLRQIAAGETENQQLRARIEHLTSWNQRMFDVIELVLSVGFLLPENAKEALRKAIEHGRL